MKNWFETLSEALSAEGLENIWENQNISYGETARQSIGKKHIVIFRENNGMYERPIHYTL